MANDLDSRINFERRDEFSGADDGVVSLRFSYGGTEDSHDADHSRARAFSTRRVHGSNRIFETRRRLRIQRRDSHSVIDTESNVATFGVGGGVTIDSTAEREYEECLVKSRFLHTSPAAFQLFESILLEGGEYFLLPQHLERLKNSAEFFGFTFCEDEIEQALDRVAAENPAGALKVKLTLSKHGHVETETSAIAIREHWRVALANQPVDALDRFLFHKTTRRDFYNAQLEARPDCDDIIFWNQRGEITESSIANVVVSIDGQLFTPPVESGLLAGTFRNQLLHQGKIKERVITIEEYKRANEIFLINSVRKCMKAAD